MVLSSDSGNVIIGLDIGTSKVAAIVGEVSQSGQLSIKGIGSYASTGLKRGVVVNVDATVNAIKHAIQDAELMAGCHIESVYVGIAGNHIASFNSSGIVAINNREIENADIERVIDSAQVVAIPADKRILHVLPQEFLVDSEVGVKDPLGMAGTRLEVKVHIMTCAVNAAKNIENCVRQCGLEVNDIVLEPLASGESVLTEDEKELGVCLVDIGGGTTDIAIFIAGSICYTAVVPIAGSQVTNDIAVALRTPVSYAEVLKHQYASAVSTNIDENDIVKVSSMGNSEERIVSKKVLVEVVHARYEELFKLIKIEISNSGLEHLIPGGVVLTGGTSQVEGAVELAENIFHTSVRIGMPQSVELTDQVCNPKYSTGVGLLYYAIKCQKEKNMKEILSQNGIFTRFIKWFKSHL